VLAALEAAQVGLGDPLVGLDCEQQGDVYVDALVDRLLDRRNPGGSPGYLDHQVGTVHRLPVHARHVERSLGVVGALRRHPQPHAHPSLAQLGQALVYSSSGSAHRPISSLPTCATRCAVIPKCSYTSLYGPDSPKVSIPMNAPASPIHLSHPIGLAASTATRA